MSCSIGSVILINTLLGYYERIDNNFIISFSALISTSFKKAVDISLIKKPTLDPDTLGNYRPVSNPSFISKILE